MASIEVTEQKQVHITSDGPEGYSDIIHTAHKVTDVEESRDYQLVQMGFPPPIQGGGMILIFQRSRGGGGDAEPAPEAPPEQPRRASYPFPISGFGTG